LEIVGENGVHSHIGDEVVDGADGTVTNPGVENAGAKDELIG
jgi:hypothetical protein